MNPIISVENLSKVYRIGAKEEVPDTLVGAAKGILKSPFENLRRLRSLDTSHSSKFDVNSDTEILWALQDVCFEVNQGDVVGVIGHNGAGKSTLLKILSRITEPTHGRAVIRGRVSSLLEVGTGFHPELTGRENIYMNGTILGMTKREIDRKFDEIVDFSGVEKFLDTPSKRYSSGMQVRLAFAVAAHLEPEILIVDEVLAVGDYQFQQKCVAKMKDVSTDGRTVVFVSHNLAALRSLCERGIVLNAGQIVEDATIGNAIQAYTSISEAVGKGALETRLDRTGSGRARLVDIEVQSCCGGTPQTGENIEFCFQFTPSLEGVECKFTIYDSQSDPVISLDSAPWTELDQCIERKSNKLVCRLPECPLLPGIYYLNVAIREQAEKLDHVPSAIRFEVAPGVLGGRKFDRDQSHSKFATKYSWQRLSG